MAKREQIIRGCVWGVILGTIVAFGGILKQQTVTGEKPARDLHKAKGIYLALKMYAGDHDGAFPSLLPDGSPVTTANQAYRALIPEYVQTEEIFYVKGSAWTPMKPDDVIEGNRKLAAGENAFAYVSNLTDVSNPDFPLVATGFLKGKPGVYGDDPTLKGGISKGAGFVVVRVDGSGKRERLEEYDRSLFNPAPEWLAPNQVPLNPE